MSGHSKWHNIRLRKGKQDAERGKIFTKLAKEIIIAARDGGGSPETNFKLRLAIQKAKDNSMPADNIKRAVQRGADRGEGSQLEEIMYEGYGAAGVAIIAQCLTDNKNRTVPEVRHAFSKCGGNMSESGSVSWQFKQHGIINIPEGASTEDTLMEIAVDAGADDVVTTEDGFEVTMSVENFGAVRQKIEDAGIKIALAELTFSPQNTVQVTEKSDADKIFRLMDMLDNLDDVQNVYANFDIPDEMM